MDIDNIKKTYINDFIISKKDLSRAQDIISQHIDNYIKNKLPDVFSKIFSTSEVAI